MGNVSGIVRVGNVLSGDFPGQCAGGNCPRTAAIRSCYDVYHPHCSEHPIVLGSYYDTIMCGNQPVELCNIRYPSKLILNSNLAKSHSSITSVSVVQSFGNFVQITAVLLSYSVQNFKTLGLLTPMIWTYDISRDLSLRWVSYGYPILPSTPDVLGWVVHVGLGTGILHGLFIRP